MAFSLLGAGPLKTEPPIYASPLKKGGWMLALHVKPGARKTDVVGVEESYGGRLLLRIAESPLEGKANRAVLAFLAERLQLPKSALVLSKGHSSRFKLVHVSGEALDWSKLSNGD